MGLLSVLLLLIGLTYTAHCQSSSYTSSHDNVGAIIGGSFAGFTLLCCMIYCTFVICVFCCFGFGAAAAANARRMHATLVTTGSTSATVTTTNTSDATAPPPAYDQQLPPQVAYPAAGYDEEKAPYPPQQGYPSQPSYPPQEGYPTKEYDYSPRGSPPAYSAHIL